ncbi:SitI3 family protein [Actinophytocola xanthii]
MFRFDKFADPINQKKDMLRLVVAVLEAFPGDALLEFAGESGVR